MAERIDGKRRFSRQVPAGVDSIGIKLADINFAALVLLERTRHKRKCPERSDAEIDEAIFSTILNLMDEMSGGRASRDKGNRTERAIVRLLQGHGFASERVPLSGSARGRFSGDVIVPLLGADRRVEVKCRGDGFRELYRWLGNGADFLIIKRDRDEPLVVIRLKLAAEIAMIAERAK